MPICLLVRHGRTSANVAGILAGWTPGVDLDDQGQAGARALGERLAGLPLRLVATSPLERCRQTAELITHPGAPVQIVDDLGECRYGAWTGRSLQDLAKEPLWRVVQDQPSAAVFPDGPDFPGESIAAMSSRAVAAVRSLDTAVRAEHGEGALWVAVSHGDVIKAILADAAGAHLDAFQRFVAGPASLSVVRYSPGRTFVERVNDTGADLSRLVPAAPSETPEPGAGATADAAVGGGV
ncbi:putative phosphomutase (TIGR03848 family) [Kineosphaera limosa]|uniref:Phosphoglycerate mutase family protein n=1 Tax=Kineosphaera limosa NBRC 100340 TaxID=1184609 RepID=K6WR00_9MICO|nr:MSMEG_4193 family putative phosphomutase [Kineosphaera limosa]NYE03195.1 putative phosphomutase (TIGR03848 family) [Kineosphaera limosa]GAB94532.1 phosphoglycerate mutase family protein [Kineosphaera limosa NBRC 100340]